MFAGTDAGWGSLSPVRSFTVGMPTYAGTGTVKDSSGAGIAGVTVSGGGRSALTDASGSYYLEGLLAGAYTLTPSLAGYTFSPASRTVTVPPDATGQDFVATSLPSRLKLLYVPLRWQGSQASFDAEARRRATSSSATRLLETAGIAWLSKPLT